MNLPPMTPGRDQEILKLHDDPSLHQRRPPLPSKRIFLDEGLVQELRREVTIRSAAKGEVGGQEN
jgi:hypothetical protein